MPDWRCRRLGLRLRGRAANHVIDIAPGNYGLSPRENDDASTERIAALDELAIRATPKGPRRHFSPTPAPTDPG
jgi:hypothetical protein